MEYLLKSFAHPQTSQRRKDRLAEICMPYMHPRLNAVAAVNASANSCPPLEIKIFSVPRGAQVVDGKIIWPDGTSPTAEETAFRPYKPTPALPALTDQSAAVEPLEVVEPEPDDPKVEVLDVWRRRSGGDDVA